jgi:hypothetical protein
MYVPGYEDFCHGMDLPMYIGKYGFFISGSEILNSGTKYCSWIFIVKTGHAICCAIYIFTTLAL